MTICDSGPYRLKHYGEYKDMCKIISSIKSKHTSDSLYDIMKAEQYRINFPMLYLASIYLYAYATKKGCKHFLFATRDCCHWYKIFKAMFPHADVHYFHSSRKMLEAASSKRNKGYDSYVDSIIGNEASKTIFVDIHGTGRRMYRYFKGRGNGDIPQCFLLSATHKSEKGFSSSDTKRLMEMGKFKTLLFDFRGSPVEMLNYDLVGTLKNWNRKGPVRDRPEYDVNLVWHYHQAMGEIIGAIKPFDHSKLPSCSKQAHALLDLIERVSERIRTEYPVISEQIKHVANHR